MYMYLSIYCSAPFEPSAGAPVEIHVAPVEIPRVTLEIEIAKTNSWGDLWADEKQKTKILCQKILQVCNNFWN